MADLTRTKAQVGVVFSDRAEIYNFITSVTVEAGEAVAVGTDGQLDLADGSTGGNAAATRGIALNDGAAGDAVSVLKSGAVYGFDLSGLNGDAPVYVSATDGELADAAAAVSFQIGIVHVLADANASKVLFIDVPWNN